MFHIDTLNLLYCQFVLHSKWGQIPIKKQRVADSYDLSPNEVYFSFHFPSTFTK